MRYVEKSALNMLVSEAQTILATSKHYNESDRIKEIIRILYSGCCVFCGSSPEASSYFQIEHFYPKGKTKYKKYELDIFNLHYGCQRCNNLKSTPVRYDIFSPNCYLYRTKWIHTKPDKIDRELIYIGHLLFSINNKSSSVDRAAATIKLFDLNDLNGGGRSGRRYLVEERLKTFSRAYQILDILYHLIAEESIIGNIDRAIKQLFLMLIIYCSPTSSFSNMIIQNFGEDIIRLLQIYQIKRKSTRLP